MLVFHITVLQSLHLHQALNPQPYNEERKKIREKKTNTTLFKNWFLFEKKRFRCYGGWTFSSISPLWQSVTINIHQGFHTHAKKKIVHHKMEEDDIDVSCSLTGRHQQQSALLKRRFYANIMPKIVGQME